MEAERNTFEELNEDTSKYDRSQMLDYIDRLHKLIKIQLDKPLTANDRLEYKKYLDNLNNILADKHCTDVYKSEELILRPIYEPTSKIVDGEEVAIDGSDTRNMIKALHDPNQTFVKYWQRNNQEFIDNHNAIVNGLKPDNVCWYGYKDVAPISGLEAMRNQIDAHLLSKEGVHIVDYVDKEVREPLDNFTTIKARRKGLHKPIGWSIIDFFKNKNKRKK